MRCSGDVVEHDHQSDQWLDEEDEGKENLRLVGLRIPDEVRGAVAVATTDDDVLEASDPFLDEDFDFDGSFTDLEAMRRDGIRLPTPPPLLLLPSPEDDFPVADDEEDGGRADAVDESLGSFDDELGGLT